MYRCNVSGLVCNYNNCIACFTFSDFEQYRHDCEHCSISMKIIMPKLEMHKIEYTLMNVLDFMVLFFVISIAKMEGMILFDTISFNALFKISMAIQMFRTLATMLSTTLAFSSTYLYRVIVYRVAIYKEKKQNESNK